jgi:hypothetical protein
MSGSVVDPHQDPDPDTSFKKMLKPLKKCINRLIPTFWLDICKLMRIRMRFRNQLINLDADPDFYLIQVTKMMQILADSDPDPRH